MKKLLILFTSLIIFFILYWVNINNIYTLSIIMLTHINGIPAPTWIIMNTSYLYGPHVTIPIMSFLWFVNSTLFFLYWRWVFYYRNGKDRSSQYIEYVQKKSTNSRFYKLLYRGLTVKPRWYIIALIRLINVPFGGSVMICSSLKNTSIMQYMIGNAIAIVMTTCYFSLAINLIKMAKIPTSIKLILYLIHMF